MNQALIVGGFCAACGSARRPQDRFCSRCGEAISGTAATEVLAPEATTQIIPAETTTAVSTPTPGLSLSPSVVSILNNRFAIFAVMACAGPMGLPLLWFSPRFSRVTKIVTSVLFVGLTVVFPIAVTIYWMEVALRPLVDAFQEVNG